MVDLPDTMLHLPDTMIDLPDIMVDLFDTMVDLPDTMVDHPDTMVDLPDTMVDLPDTMSHISSCFFPFHLVFPIHSSLFFKFNSRSSALIALALISVVVINGLKFCTFIPFLVEQYSWIFNEPQRPIMSRWSCMCIHTAINEQVMSHPWRYAYRPAGMKTCSDPT